MIWDAKFRFESAILFFLFMMIFLSFDYRKRNYNNNNNIKFGVLLYFPKTFIHFKIDKNWSNWFKTDEN